MNKTLSMVFYFIELQIKEIFSPPPSFYAQLCRQYLAYPVCIILHIVRALSPSSHRKIEGQYKVDGWPAVSDMCCCCVVVVTSTAYCVVFRSSEDVEFRKRERTRGVLGRGDLAEGCRAGDGGDRLDGLSAIGASELAVRRLCVLMTSHAASHKRVSFLKRPETTDAGSPSPWRIPYRRSSPAVCTILLP